MRRLPEYLHRPDPARCDSVEPLYEESLGGAASILINVSMEDWGETGGLLLTLEVLELDNSDCCLGRRHSAPVGQGRLYTLPSKFCGGRSRRE